MNIFLIVFPNSLILISQVEATDPEEIGDPDLRLVEPFEVKGDFLEPWLISFTTQNKFEMHSDKLVTMASPNPSLLAKYKELIK
jgi:hypothetical protein